MTRIALIGDYDPASSSHAATNSALRHAADRLKVEVSSGWVATPSLDDSMFEHFAAIWIAPGSPYKDMERVLSAIRFAREHAVPCLGTCGGFQHMVIEYARNVLGLAGAQHGEYAPGQADAFITPLACSLAGRSMNLTFKADSRVADAYGSTSATEQYYCSFGVNPERVAELKSGPLQVSGSDAEGEVRVIELPDHPFFLGTLFLPQLRSLPGRPHPLISAFVRAAVKRGKTL
ncbi:MAG TPA: hypothetical protein VJV78_04960 [Polyangiales bacterium]|nr:hypothetical protein [Polyangiales bacterium]